MIEKLHSVYLDKINAPFADDKMATIPAIPTIPTLLVSVRYVIARLTAVCCLVPRNFNAAYVFIVRIVCIVHR